MKSFLISSGGDVSEPAEHAPLEAGIQARFGSHRVLVKELTSERCRIEHRAPIRLHGECELVIPFQGETLFFIARAERSRCTGFDPILGPRYESELRCIHADARAREALAPADLENAGPSDLPRKSA